MRQIGIAHRRREGDTWLQEESTTVGLGERRMTVNQDSLTELSRSVSQAAGALFAAGTVTETLTSVVELAVATIEGCDYAGLFTMDAGAITTPALFCRRHPSPLCQVC